ncbi:acetate kinase [Alsobacter soli]|uniref:Acetate kinase n=1 Tax=Alsobacter soli TaxID=2109933 RepID=A0A2T1HUS6_9HYPH|nr:acetate/propionate family kinase [Alsobacter soli]PSC05378.1 acetate kinase [Alsobacter soli]
MSACLLTLNAGSSSLKFAAYALRAGEPWRLARGQAEGLKSHARFEARLGDEAKQKRTLGDGGPASHRQALDAALAWLGEKMPGLEVAAVGHRVVHGGRFFAGPVVVTDEILQRLRLLEPLAPLHQPHNLAGIEVARQAFPDAVHVACFDTAFHRGHAFAEEAYGLPREMFEAGIRRYGFHGLSYESVMRLLPAMAPTEWNKRVIVAHLGNGASMCAIQGGASVASTMGFTALDGLPMGTRCGQLDPGVLLFLMAQRGMDAASLTQLLYNECGLKGLSGISSDMRELEASDRPEAQEAIAYFVGRIRREMGALAATMRGVDAIVFTGGIGENAWRIREMALEGAEWLGIELDPEANRAGGPVISARHSRVKAFVVKTDEEAAIARHTMEAAGLGARPEPRAKTLAGEFE